MSTHLHGHVHHHITACRYKNEEDRNQFKCKHQPLRHVLYESGSHGEPSEPRRRLSQASCGLHKGAQNMGRGSHNVKGVLRDDVPLNNALVSPESYEVLAEVPESYEELLA